MQKPFAFWCLEKFALLRTTRLGFVENTGSLLLYFLGPFFSKTKSWRPFEAGFQCFLRFSLWRLCRLGFVLGRELSNFSWKVLLLRLSKLPQRWSCRSLCKLFVSLLGISFSPSQFLVSYKHLFKCTFFWSSGNGDWGGHFFRLFVVLLRWVFVYSVGFCRVSDEMDLVLWPVSSTFW